MKLVYNLAHAILQGALAEMFLLGWRIYEVQDIFQVIGSTSMLIFVVGLYGTFFGLVMQRRGFLMRLVAVPFFTSIFTAATFAIYPQIGFTGVDWSILLVLLLGAGILAHLLMYGAGAEMTSQRRDEL